MNWKIFVYYFSIDSALSLNSILCSCPGKVSCMRLTFLPRVGYDATLISVRHSLLSLKADTATEVSMLNEAFSISHSANILVKNMNATIILSSYENSELFSLDLSTGRREEKVWMRGSYRFVEGWCPISYFFVGHSTRLSFSQPKQYTG